MRISSRLFQKLQIDKVVLKLRAGNGANGAANFRGKGGNGGNIIFVGNSKTNLDTFRESYPGFHINAPDGQLPRRNCMIGISGEDVLVNVPTGIDISTKNGENLGTIVNNKDKMLACRGGIGGGPLNNYIAQRGEVISIVLNLKLIADIGLIGFPNAGKSSLLKAISGAPAKIANYAFTTLRPQVANVIYEDERSISIADLPGIIEGAHVNVGLGHHFLKHLERTKVHLFVVDLHGFKLMSKKLLTSYRSPMETILLLVQELEMFNRSLVDKPAICVLNKVDKKEGRMIAEMVTEQLLGGKMTDYMNDEICPSKMVSFNKIVPISAATGEGIVELKEAIRELLDEVALLDNNGASDLMDRLDDECKEHTPSLV